MKINAIRSLVEAHSLETLSQLQHHIENEIALPHPVEGDDEGEQLTHILGAIWIKEQMQANGSDFKTELRNFTSRVRGSIS